MNGTQKQNKINRNRNILKATMRFNIGINAKIIIALPEPSSMRSIIKPPINPNTSPIKYKTKKA
jgi:hypothetical protein